MKRTILASIIGIAAAMAVNSANAQGHINLDNYDSSVSPLVTYQGTTTGVSGAAWTVGFYYGLGTISVPTDPTGTADPGVLSGGALAVASGAAGDTTVFSSAVPGTFTTTGNAVINGYTSGEITVEMVSYNGSTYGTSAERGHSGAFQMTAATGNNAAPLVGNFMPAFSVVVPEPSVFALSGIGAAALMLIRRKK